MNTTIRVHNRRAPMIALLAVLLLLAVALVFAVPSASDRDVSRANHAMSAEESGRSTITKDPNIERHAEVVERLGNGSLR